MKMKNKNKKSVRSIVLRGGLIVIAAVFSLATVSNYAFADNYDDQIEQLQNEIGSFQQEAARLNAQADTLQRALSVLTNEKNRIQAQVDLTQAKHDKLVQEIEENQKKLEKQKRVYAERVADLSANTKTSPIELLAGSQSIGDYIRGDAYQSSIQDQIKSAIKMVKELKVKLAKQKKEVEVVLADQQKQRDLLASKEAEQAKLLADTQGQEAAYQNVISQKNSQVSSLRAAQAAAMRSGSGAENIVYGSSSYPWMDSTMAYDDYCQYYSGGSAADPFGYCKRQCVSYVAWKLNTDGRGNRGYSQLGNANMWSGGGSLVATELVAPGDVIIWYVGGYGHVMYVESVAGGNVHISQMNVPYDSGQYSEADYSLGTLINGPYEVRRYH